MTRLRNITHFLAASVGILLLAKPSPLLAVEKTITLTGRVDVSGLNTSPGRFTVRALRPQKRAVELGGTVTDSDGRFRLTVDDEAVGVYGVVLEATSAKDPALAMEAAVLRIREAKAPIAINPATTVEAAILHWKISRHGENFESIRPFLLFQWLRPLLRPKARQGLRRAEVALVRWAHGTAASDSRTVASVLRASVGDLRQIRKRLTALKVSSKAIAQVEQMVRADAEVAYLLMMPYLLEL
ncbi:MAG: hypothetical protein ACE5I9_00895 [Candidatus Methylomirabilales bacterium]